MSVVTITDGQQVIQDPSAVRVYVFDFDAVNLATSVTISGTPTYTVTAISPSTTDTALTLDQKSVLSGSRKTQFRASTPTLGQLYRVACLITTNETPSQVKEKSFFILGQDE